MSTRKIILLSLIAVLLTVYVVQLVSAGRNDVTVVSVTEDINQIIIEKQGADTVTLSKNGDVWIVRIGNEEPSAADESVVLRALSAIKEIRVLETVSRSGDDERYGFADSPVTVTASAGGKTVRTMCIGKRAETRLQSYVKLDSSDSIVLISGTPADAFDKKRDDWIQKVQEPVVSSDGAETTAEVEPADSL